MTIERLGYEAFENDILETIDPAELGAEAVLLRVGQVLSADAGLVWFPLTALVRVEAGDPNVFCGFVDHRGAVGLFEAMDLAPTSITYAVQVTGKAIAVPKHEVLVLAARNAAFNRSISRWLAASGREALEQAAFNVRGTATQRISCFLADIARVHGDQPFLISQVELARSIGLQRSTVSGIVADLKRRKLIKHSRGTIRVPNPERLCSGNRPAPLLEPASGLGHSKSLVL